MGSGYMPKLRNALKMVPKSPNHTSAIRRTIGVRQMTRKLYQAIASRIDAMANCGKMGNPTWHEKHWEMAEALTREFMPSGGGFDSGTKLDAGLSTGKKLVFHTSFHHMDDNGCYDGWT